ncbi:hypothetical protein VQ02_15120 [Methylobacterium variabile]|uniref:DUF6894 domain-containing protein n=1 Tax=Methylobacterium variabile TaxID=298794 RepID=A0A0J6VC32_9HYPH|nr:hypothetical protein VQ02_15120 [Methylobacterium variabile]
MPRFFFDICDGVTVRDDQGHEFADLNAVRGQLQRLLGDLIGHRRPGANAIQLRIDVRDESGARVAMVTLAAVIE